MAFWVHHKVLGRVEFQFLTFIEEKNFITFDNSVYPMSNCEGRGILELLSDELLNFLLSDNIDIGGGLIQDDNFGCG